MNVLDLFSGIGGFSLGLERAGMRTVAFCEIEPSARLVLAEHWPHVPCYPDVRELCAARLTADGIAADVICGGFPCQDISLAGKGVGLAGERSGLWREYARIVGDVRPGYVIVENVAALLNRGLDVVLGDLASLGYDAEWHCIPASAIGAPHRRDRLWIIAHAKRERTSIGAASSSRKRSVPDQDGKHSKRALEPRAGGDADALADAIGSRGPRLVTSADIGPAGPWRLRGQEDLQLIAGTPFERGDRWPQPLIRRVDDGVSGRVDRLHGIGNAVVPQIPEIIGRAIMRSALTSGLVRE